MPVDSVSCVVLATFAGPAWCPVPAVVVPAAWAAASLAGDGGAGNGTTTRCGGTRSCVKGVRRTTVRPGAHPAGLGAALVLGALAARGVPAAERSGLVDVDAERTGDVYTSW